MLEQAVTAALCFSEKSSRMLKGAETITLAISVLYFSMLSSPILASENECRFQLLSDRIYVIVGSNHETCLKKTWNTH